jgi:hypothetical protein
MAPNQDDAAAVVVPTPPPPPTVYPTPLPCLVPTALTPSRSLPLDGHPRERQQGMMWTATKKMKISSPWRLPLLTLTRAARPSASNASSLSREGEMNSGRATPASVRHCLPRTKRRAKSLCLIAVIFYLFPTCLFGSDGLLLDQPPPISATSTPFAISSRQDLKRPKLKSTDFDRQ